MEGRLLRFSRWPQVFTLTKSHLHENCCPRTRYWNQIATSSSNSHQKCRVKLFLIAITVENFNSIFYNNDSDYWEVYLRDSSSVITYILYLLQSFQPANGPGTIISSILCMRKLEFPKRRLLPAKYQSQKWNSILSYSKVVLVTTEDESIQVTFPVVK